VTQVLTKTLYEQDFHLWLTETVELLKARQVERLDYDNLIEELASMGISQKHALKSNLTQILMHLLKWRYQPEKQSKSWRYTLLEHRDRIEESLQDSPSLRVYFNEILDSCYQKARRYAQVETGLPISTFPEMLPFATADILDPDYYPEALHD
jgi:hypothetical protein